MKVPSRDIGINGYINKSLTSEMNYHGMLVLTVVSNSEKGLVTDDRFMITILVLNRHKLRELSAL